MEISRLREIYRKLDSLNKSKDIDDTSLFSIKHEDDLCFKNNSELFDNSLKGGSNITTAQKNTLLQ